MKTLTARLHENPDSEKVKFIGEVTSTSIKSLKDKIRTHARNNNSYGRIHVSIIETSKEFYVIVK